MSGEMDRYELEDLIERLESIRGRNTELVSLYIPEGYEMSEIINFLTEEKSEAENIKSKSTRKNVQAALDKIQRRLKEVGETPEKGVALFAGNVSEQEGRPEIEMWEVVPPEPVGSRRYRCDKEFVLEPLENLVIESDIYGLVVVDRSEAAIGYLKGNTLRVEQTLSSNVPGKTKAGGQSQQRFERIRENLYDTFLNQVAEAAKKAFFDKAREGELLGIIIGGPGFAKDDLIDKDYLHRSLEDAIIARKDTNYSGEEGLHELMEKSEDVIEESQAIREQELVKEFLTNLKEENGLSTYGLEEVAKALNMGAVDKVLISEDVDMVEVTYKCGEEDEVEYVDRSDLEGLQCDDGSDPDIVDQRGLVEVVKEKAEQMDTEVHRISPDSKEGKRLKNMGGIAAILRYRIN
ncbi:MAG: peptide chain release factor aRF-1 [Candidatus Nanohaloarchaeota archaeon QJJ-7]|nr:peptide chain release factor aRF-1 [Candidatus Nanohaloarchaeota archaeon QJJ-7]